MLGIGRLKNFVKRKVEENSPDNTWHYPFTREEKLRFKRSVPTSLWEDEFMQRLYFIDPKEFELLIKDKEKLKELV